MTMTQTARTKPVMLKRIVLTHSTSMKRSLQIALFAAACLATTLPARAMQSGFNPGSVVSNVMEKLPPGSGFGFAVAAPLDNSATLPVHRHRKKASHD